jgi:hypothetical protein
MKRGRWSGKSKGGRRAYWLDTDSDCWVIVAALWFRHDPKDQRSFAVLQALNFLLTPHDSIEVALGTRVVDGIEKRCLGLTNTQPARGYELNRPDREPLSAPDGRTFRHSRLKLLQKKVDFYRRAKLSKIEISFCSQCFLALHLLVTGREGEAMLVCATVGWAMNERRARDWLQSLVYISKLYLPSRPQRNRLI